MDVRACYKMLMRGVPSSKKVHPPQPKRKPDEPIKRKFEENESKADDKIKKLKTEPECKEDSSSDDSSDEEQDVKLMTDVKIVEEEPKQPTKEEIAQALLEKVKEIRRRNRIFFDGTDMPVPVETFEQLVDTYKLNTNIMKNISNKLEYKTPTPIQMQSIPAMMQRRELLACAPTGSGKTAAFLIPLLQHLKEPARQGFRAVIVEPTKELARQVFWECNRLADGHGFRVKLIDDVKRSCKNSKQKPSDKVDILITTPQRLIHLLIKEDGPALSLKNVEWLIVDEADKLFELGAEKKNFRQQLGNIYRACDGNKVRRAFFSATYTAEVEDWCKTNLDNLLCVYIGDKNSAVDTVKQELKYTGWDAGKMFEMKNIFNKGIDLPALIFVDSKERAKMLFRELIVLYPDKRINVIHSDLTQQQREDVMKSFRAGKVWILITTELLCRGIDFKGVKLVINYDMPSSAISYVHRIGRTGRAGETGTAITFFGDDDKYGLGNIAEVMKDSGFEVPDFIFELPRSKHAVQKKKRKNTV